MSAHSKDGTKRHISLTTHLISGGLAGLVESSACHPLDTIKVRMQLQGRSKIPNSAALQQRLGPMSMASHIFKQEGIFAFYKGFGAVVSAIVPKMAIRFSSFEFYKRLLSASSSATKATTTQTFIAGLGAGITESILVVNPIEVVKIRLQAQKKTTIMLGGGGAVGPLDSAGPHVATPYRNAPHALYRMIKEEGLASLYKGVSLTAARQATNQAVNFTLYQKGKQLLSQAQGGRTDLPSWQHFLVGGISGAIAPLANAPIDTLKTRIQKQRTVPGESGWLAIQKCFQNILKNEGPLAFYNGLTPRLMRIAPGQAITFAVYEKVHPIVSPWIDHDDPRSAHSNSSSSLLK